MPLLGLCLISAVMTLNAQAAGGATTYYGHWVRLENAGEIPVAYDPQGLAVRVGRELFPSALVEASGAIPPRSASEG